MAKMRHSELVKTAAKKLRGFSTPIGGATWEPPKLESDEVRKLLTFLEDRRVLHVTDDGLPYERTRAAHILRPQWIVKSVEEMREQVTACLQTMQFSDRTRSSLERMRRACREYLNSRAHLRPPPKGAGKVKPRDKHTIDELTKSLAEFRIVMGVEVARLCALHRIDVEDDLVPLVKFGFKRMESELQSQ